MFCRNSLPLRTMALSAAAESRLLDFQKHMALDLLSTAALVPLNDQRPAANPTAPTSTSEGKGDGLLISAKGLGQRSILLALVQIYADPRGLVLLLNTPQREIDVLKEDLMALHAATDLAEFLPPASAQRARSPPAADDERGEDAAAYVSDGGLGSAEAVGSVGGPEFFRTINNETTSAERAHLYLAGGVLSVTSQILVVDMLNKVLPVNKILGIIVNHAHRVNDTSMEAFILRLFRDDNKEGFIKALSDEPEAFTRGYWKLERSMKTLFLRHVFLWPRFHMTVQENVEKGKVELHECKVKLTQPMKEIQAGLIDCIDQCLAELRRSNPTIDADELTVENAFFRSFDQIVRSQLDPLWHRVSSKTKLLVADLKILRRLLSYLISYDCVTFNSFLETIVAANATNASAVFRSEASQSPWLLLDSAQLVLQAARQRVYRRLAGEVQSDEGVVKDLGIPPNVEPVLEEQPKWRVLRDIMREIERDRARRADAGEVPGSVLIMVDGDRACRQLREILSRCDLTYVKPEPMDVDASPDEKRNGESSNKRKAQHEETGKTGSERLLTRLLHNYFRWKGGMAAVSKNLFRKGRASKPATTTTTTSYAARGRGGSSAGGRGQPPAAKRRRTRGGGAAGADIGRNGEPNPPGIGDTGLPITFEQEAEQIADYLSQVDPHASQAEPHLLDHGQPDLVDPVVMQSQAVGEELSNDGHSWGVIPPAQLVIVRPYATTSMALAGGSASNGDDDARVLEDIRPEYVVLYDPDLGFVRRVECYKALNTLRKLRVYYLVYENSVEEQRFLSLIRNEKAAFEKLIREKGIMAIPIDQDGRVAKDPDAEFWRTIDTRLAGGQVIPAANRDQVVVDVREFRSSLPALLHAAHLNLRACTLAVGDYVLSPSVCVERKSLPDLVGSLKSGRLYSQCEAMSLHYKTPVLLIEFEKSKAGFFSGEGKEIDSRDVGARLALLVLHFQKLRIVWSSSPAATAEIFVELKKNQEEPDMKAAMAVGVDSSEAIDSAYSITPSDVLRSLPGITSKNYRRVMSQIRDLKALSELDLDACCALVGKEFGTQLHAFFRADPKDEATLVGV
ncbi:hypothetical protein HDU89_001383 [Geranomyces variabilis]|nr:hypothetical protein HDU89_001383 [Geranomyces variabilis]